MKLHLKRKQVGIFGKITICVFLMVTIIITIIVSICIKSVTEVLTEKEWIITEQAVKTFVDLVNEKYQFVTNQRTRINRNNSISDILYRGMVDKKTFRDYGNIEYIMNDLNTILQTDGDILDVILVAPENDFSYARSNRHGSTVLPSYDFAQMSMIRNLQDSAKTFSMVYDADPAYVSNSDQAVISFCGKIYNMQLNRSNVIGYLIINYSVDIFDAALAQFASSEQEQYVLTNPSNEVCYSNRPEQIGVNLMNMDIRSKDKIIQARIGNSGIRVIAVFPNNIAAPTINAMLRMLIPVFVIGTLIIFAVIFLLYRIYRQKVHSITRSMISIGQGRMDERLAVSSDDELGQLSDAFNRMCESLNQYIELNYKAELAKQRAELNALQVQINPHFLFNTIESIRMQALIDQNGNVAEMLAKLGNMFRWMMQFDDHFVYVEDEIEYISSYLYLQKLRFGNRIEVEMNVPDSIMYLGIPRFTLQPIVENAICHCIKGTKRLCICIDARIENQMLHLEIRDNGVGIPKDRLIRLQKSIDEQYDDAQFGIGLRNVNLRLKILYGEAAGLRIESVPERGTKITVILPAQKKKEMDEHVSHDPG